MAEALLEFRPGSAELGDFRRSGLVLDERGGSDTFRPATRRGWNELIDVWMSRRTAVEDLEYGRNLKI